MKRETIIAMEITGFEATKRTLMKPTEVEIRCTGNQSFVVTFEDSHQYHLNDTVEFSVNVVRK